MSLLLRQIAPEGSRIRIALQPNEVIVIGRQPPPTQSSIVDVELNSEQIASRHVRLTVNETEAECSVTDLGSEYGTRINGNRLEPQIATQLVVGGELTLGFDYTFVLEQSSRPVRSYNEITSVVEDERLPSNIAADERYVPLPHVGQIQPYSGQIPPGLARYSVKLINYLPEIYRPSGRDGMYTMYQNDSDANLSGGKDVRLFIQEQLNSYADFTNRLLALIESVLLPIEWTATNFDLFLHVDTAPQEFLTWLEQWFMLLTDASWTEEQRRTFIAEANWLFMWRGTKKALTRVLKIYTGEVSPIVEMGDPGATAELSPYEFQIQLKIAANYTQVDPAVVRKIIDAFKPAHTIYKLTLG